MRKPYQSPGRMKNSSYSTASVGDRTRDLPHTVASNTVKVSHVLNHSATAAVERNATAGGEGARPCCLKATGQTHRLHTKLGKDADGEKTLLKSSL